MNSLQFLPGKRALAFGAGGSVGAAAAREFAAEGAEVFLSGRNKGGVEEVKRSIEEAGVKGHAAVDALDEKAVQRYIDGVVERAGGATSYSTSSGPRRRNTEPQNLHWTSLWMSTWPPRQLLCHWYCLRSDRDISRKSDVRTRP